MHPRSRIAIYEKLKQFENLNYKPSIPQIKEYTSSTSNYSELNFDQRGNHLHLLIRVLVLLFEACSNSSPRSIDEREVADEEVCHIIAFGPAVSSTAASPAVHVGDLDCAEHV